MFFIYLRIKIFRLKLFMYLKVFFFYKNYYWKIYYKENNVIILDFILKKVLILDVIFIDI